MTDAISVTGLVKTFGPTKALNGLDLTVRTGEIHGFLGPNGAGKTTTIRVLLGLMRSDGGTVKLLGGDPWADTVTLHRKLAYVPGDVTLWPNLSGGETIDLLGRMRGGIDPKRKAELVEGVGHNPKKKGRPENKGHPQKVALIAALASDVELLILDEPTSGLDPLMEETFRQVLEEHRRDRTILLSSHILSEVEALCDRVSIIRDGRIVDSGTLEEMRQFSHISVTAELEGTPTGLQDLSGVHNLTVDGNKVQCDVDRSALTEVLQRLSAVGVRDLKSQPPTLEELFLRHYGAQEAVASR
jgi:ABC-2 type transport system ATP-binding protein